MLQHSGGDLRANLLLRLAEEHAIVGTHIEMLYRIRDILPETLGRMLPINVNGAIPAVMLDVGFPLSALKGISLLARTASIIAHLQEETERPIGFIMSAAAADKIRFIQASGTAPFFSHRSIKRLPFVQHHHGFLGEVYSS